MNSLTIAHRGKWMLRQLLLCAQGAIVGAGTILPGVSGGVFCVAFGVYEPMMALLARPGASFKRYYRLFIPFLVGWVLGFVLLAGVVERLFAASSSVAMALFAGLIFGTVPELFKQSGESNPGQGLTAFAITLALSFALLSFLQTGSAAAITPNALWYVFCGATWGLSLVLPGLSSSSILILMGLYLPMTAGIAVLDVAVLLPALVGFALVAALGARWVSHMLMNRRSLMLRVMLGVMIPATLLIIPTSFESGLTAALSAACFAAGFAIARWMDVVKAKQSTNAEN